MNRTTVSELLEQTFFDKVCASYTIVVEGKSSDEDDGSKASDD